MSDTIQNQKYVELTYKVIDKRTGSVITEVEFPIGYVHGASEALSPEVTQDLQGKAVGDAITLPIDCDKLYGPRDEKLVFTDHLDNVPEEYRKVGTTVVMENSEGQPKDFLVTKIDEENKTLTVDGNNPLCGREVIFTLEVLLIRDATEEEIAIGGKVGDSPDINEILH
ncbi:MAG: hypothetical protein V3V09_02495 [Arenicellales bacterium]